MDTHAFLWWVEDDPQISQLARETVSDGNNEIFLSVASAWEIAIKASSGKLASVPEDLEGYLDEQLLVNGFEVLPVRLAHAVGVRHLAYHHRDPFDRMLVAQAVEEDMPLLSGDGALSPYPVRLLW